MNVTADTNVLVRVVMMDDPIQSPRAARLLAEADIVAIPLVSLCEFVWVLTRTYQQKPPLIAEAVRHLTSSAKVRTDRAAIEAGLVMLEAGGDFADGVIAHIGAASGGSVFASFDRRALKLQTACGRETLDLTTGPQGRF